MSHKTRSAARWIVAVLVAGMLAACSSIPTTGPVRAGDSGVATPEPVLPILQGPQPGDDPRAIVQGFLTASAGGTITGFDIAREYLTTEAAREWEPLFSVTIFDSRQVTLKVDDESQLVTYSLPVAAVLDESGVMTESAPEVRQDLDFQLVMTEAGEFRIDQLDPGIIISEANFVRAFRPVALAFASTDLTAVVPDMRWFANNDQLATVTARELIEGPSPWLADSVITGFPATSSLAVDAVVIDDGVARVALAAGSAGNAAQRALAAEQMALTLQRQLPAVTSVETTVGGVPLTGSAESTLEPVILPELLAVVAAGGRLGVWDGASLNVTPTEFGALPADARGLALAYDFNTAAYANGEGLWITDAPVRREEFVPYQLDAEVPEELLVASLVLPGNSLVAPSYDRFGWVWTMAQTSSGKVSVISSSDLDAEPLQLEASWLGGRSVQAIAISRDGARAAVLSRVGAQQVVEVVSVIRDGAGVPLSLGEPLGIAPSVRPAIDVAWSDTNNLVVLGEDAGYLTLATVGGRTADIAAITGAVSFSVRFGERTLVAVTEEGEFQVRSGNSWAPQYMGVTDVAFAG